VAVASELQRAAFAAGGIAHAAGQPVSDCPYTAAAPHGLRRCWLRGWAHADEQARPIPLEEAEVA
jgi:ribosome modulation factor